MGMVVAQSSIETDIELMSVSIIFIHKNWI